MEKFNIGEFYKVGGKTEEAGNVIEIVDVDRKTRTYRTVVGVPEGSQTFHIDSPFANNLKSCEEKVVIIRKSNKTIAKYYLGGKVMEERVARCCPEDEYDFATGARIAFDRMFDSSEEDVLDWDKFLNGEISVQVTRKTADDFLNVCENEGLRWSDDMPAAEWNPFEAYDNMPEDLKYFAKITGMMIGEKAWITMKDEHITYCHIAPEDSSKIFEWKNSFDWKKFEDGKLCVKLTKETEMDFLEECEMRGYHWYLYKPTEWQPNHNEYYVYCADDDNKHILYSGCKGFEVEVFEW